LAVNGHAGSFDKTSRGDSISRGMENLQYCLIDTVIGPVGLVVSGNGLVWIELRCPPEEIFIREIEKRYRANVGADQRVRPKADRAAETGAHTGAPLQEATREIMKYLEGKSRLVGIPLDLRGPDFMIRVCREMMKIPYGRTATYGEIAGRIDRPGAARAVGRAVGKNPLPIIIPCHRVIGAGGKLTGFGSGLDLKAHLLDLEKKTM